MIKRNFTLFVVLAAILICGLIPNKSHAQILEPVDYNNVNLLGAGISVGYYSYGFAGTRSLSVPPLNAYYELGVHENITAGPYVGFARWSYRYAGFFGTTAGYSWSFLNVGGRGSYHLTSLINEWFDAEIDPQRWDLYGTLLVGLEFRSFSWDNAAVEGLDSDNTVHFVLGPVLGARYYLNERIALYLEGGRGSLGAFTFGVSTNL